MPGCKKSVRIEREDALRDLLLHTTLDIAGIAKVLNRPNSHGMQMAIWRLYQRLGVGNRIGLMRDEIDRLTAKVAQLEEMLDAPAPHTKAAQAMKTNKTNGGLTGYAR